MSDCGVCLSGCGEDLIEEISSRTFRARKIHKCDECRRPIIVGQQYEKIVGKYDGDLVVYRTCLICVEIRTAFACNGSWTFTSVWEDLEESFDALNETCFSRLQTVEAKRYLRDRWMKWKGLV